MCRTKGYLSVIHPLKPEDLRTSRGGVCPGVVHRLDFQRLSFAEVRVSQKAIDLRSLLAHSSVVVPQKPRGGDSISSSVTSYLPREALPDEVGDPFIDRFPGPKPEYGEIGTLRNFKNVIRTRPVTCHVLSGFAARTCEEHVGAERELVVRMNLSPFFSVSRSTDIRWK